VSVTVEPTTVTVLSDGNDAHDVVFLDVERHEDGPYLRIDTSRRAARSRRGAAPADRLVGRSDDHGSEPEPNGNRAMPRGIRRGTVL
jgi:hypothetical protein